MISDDAKHAADCMRVIESSSAQEWQDVIGSSSVYDFYHTGPYHAIAEELGEGRAHMFVYREVNYMVALPLLLRPIATPNWRHSFNEAWMDATSVYGYAGPICSHSWMPRTVVQNFQTALYKELVRRRVVAVFSRLHPLIPQVEVLSGLGTIRALGQTVSISLRGPSETQRAQYRENHKRGIARLKQIGVECSEDQKKRFVGEFAKLYTATMVRVGAEDSYFFDESYFRTLIERLGSECHLFLAWLHGEAVAGGIFVRCGDILQDHLGASRDDCLKLAPMKLVFDSVREWGSARALALLHLGGGVGSNEDSLFQFKAGFSKNRHNFSCWQWIVNRAVYDHFCEAICPGCSGCQSKPAASEFFPAYRRPPIFLD
ncbi:MAG: hypothetical protein JWL90_1112 [Chthoniobacteraceae bacterium]|nr:hypothetical protein [Chthoniobacteraceae bacterium]